MSNLRKIAIYACVWLVSAHPALALNDTVGVTAGSGKTANLIAFGGGNVISEVGICDATTANQCAAVSAGGLLSVAATLNAETIKVIGTVNQGTSPWVVSLTSTTLTGTSAVNVSQINGVTPLMGNGVTGTGSTRVTIASDNTAFAVNAASTQSGTWTVQPGNTANTTPWLFNESQINGVTPLMNNGASGTGSQRMNVSNDNTAIANWGQGVTGAAVPSGAQYGGMSQGGNLTGFTGTSGNLNVQCANCSGSGVSTVDAATFAATTSLFAGSGGFFQTTATNNALTTGQQGMFQVTANRALFSNLRNAAGAEVGVAAVPLQVSLANTAANGTAVSVSLAANQSVNEAQINGVTPLMGNGVTGTGSQRVTIASDNTAFSVNAASTQSGTWTVQPGNTANTTPWLFNESQINGVTPLMGNGVSGTGSQRVNIASDNTAFSVNAAATQSGTWNINNIAGTVTLPTGASTAALQPTNAAQGSTTSGQTGHLVECAVTTGAPTYTTAQTDPLSCDTAGNLRVNIVTGSSSGAVAQGSTTSGQTGLLVQCAVTTSAPTYTTAQTNPLSCDTGGSTRVNVTNSTTALPDNADGIAAVSTASNSPTNAYNYVFNGTTFDRRRSGGVTGMAGVTLQATPTGAATITSAIAPATPAGVNLKASAGTVYSVNVTTIQATPIYVKFYNASSAPTCGSGTPVARFMIPANATAADGAGTNISFPVGLAFGTGIGYCVTGALADNDTTAITASNSLVNISWN